MKIFFPIGAFYPSQIGGPCNTLYWHTCALKSKGFHPTILTTTIGIKKGQVETNKWIEKPCGAIYYSHKNLLSLSKSFYELIKSLDKNEVIHLNSLFNYYSIFTYFYCKFFLRKKRIIWSVRGELNQNALVYNSWKKKPLLFFYKKINKSIVYHSTSVKETEDIKRVFPQSTIVEVPNFVESAKRLSTPVRNQLLYVGRIHPIKSIHKLIESLPLSDKFMQSDFKLIIVGKHEERHEYYKKELLELVKKLKLIVKVEFKGHLEGDEKENMYASSYALILPSETENFGNVVVESLNQGTPVIASKGTPWEVLERYNCGYHTENSPSEIAKRIDKILSLEKTNYEELRSNSLTLFDREFNIKNQITRWIKIYQNEENTK